MTHSTNRPVLGATLGILLLTVACGSGPDSDERPAPSSTPARAVEIFGDANLPSPVNTSTMPGPGSLLFQDSFETEPLADWSIAWPNRNLAQTTPPVRITEAFAHSGSHGLEVGFASGPPRVLPQLLRTLPVRPEATYLLSAAVRSEDLSPSGRESVGASVEIFEWKQPGQGQPVAYHGHLPRERGTSRQWRTVEYLFQTAPDTRFVSVALVSSNSPASGRAFFDDVSLTELTAPGTLFRSAAYLSPNRDEPHELVRNITVGDDTRPTILAPSGTSWDWPVTTNPGDLLSFGITGVGVDAATEICFRVSLGSRSLFDECIETPTGSGPRWNDRLVELNDGTSGETAGILRFETSIPATASAAVELGLWADPRLVRRRRDAKDHPPNVVFIIFDTLRADHVGAEGYTKHPTTPNLDRLAGEAVRYSNAFAPSAWTTTTLASLITSRYPSQHGAGLRIPREIEYSDVVTPVGRRALGHTGLARTEVTLAELLSTVGYETVGFHRNLLFGAGLGFARGFDRYAHYPGEGLAGAIDGTQLALEWLSDRRDAEIDEPYFLMLHLMDPHLPYRMRQEYYAEFGPPFLPPGREFESDWPFVAFHRWPRQKRLSEVETARVLAMYDSEIAYADQAAGMLLDELAADENTLVVALSDHGEAFGEHDRFEHGNSMYDELLRVPLYVRLPGGRQAGSVIEEPVSLIDVAPTVLAMVGLAPLSAMEGRTLPGLRGLPETARPREGLLAEGTFLGPDQTAVIRDGYKYVLTHPQGQLGFQDGTPAERRAGRSRPMSEELYHLRDDRSETRNLISDRAEIAAALRDLVTTYIEETSYGLHLRCEGDAGLTLESSSTIGEIKPLGLESDDAVRIADSRRRVDLAFQPTIGSSENDTDWIIVRFLESDAEFELIATAGANCAPELFIGEEIETGASELRSKLGDSSIALRPGASPGNSACWCQLWEVPHPVDSGDAASPTLDAETHERLRGLGYVR